MTNISEVIFNYDNETTSEEKYCLLIKILRSNKFLILNNYFIPDQIYFGLPLSEYTIFIVFRVCRVEKALKS